MNTYSFIPRLYDAINHGVYSFTSVLDYHKSVEDKMPEDGLVWLCEHPNHDKLLIRKIDLTARLIELQKAIKGQPYNVWQILDREAHILRCRLQLVNLCFSETYCPVS